MGENRNKCDISKYPAPVQESLIRAIEFQQNMYELSSDWNYYEESEHEYLKNNIMYTLGGVPDAEDFVEPVSKTEEEKKKEAAQKELLSELVDLIYQQILGASRTKKSLYVGVIFNVLCESDKKDNIDKKDKAVEDKKDNDDKKDEEPFGRPMPIFKVRRCMDREERLNCIKNGTTENKKIGVTALYPYCVSYIDSEGRVYKTWSDYVTGNTLPKSLMVLPMGGFYQENPHAFNTDEKTYAWIEIGPSPAAGQILPYFDTASTVLGVGALGIGIAALAAPIAAPIAVGATVCGAVSGFYTTARSGQQLVDRRKHQQSISVADRTARSAWFGVLGGVAGGAASGGTFILGKAVRAGVTVGNVGRATYNTIAVGNILINGMGIGNGLYGIVRNYQEKKEYSIIEIGQVVAHVLFFGNAVMNFQTARTIISNTQQQVLQDYEGSLRSNRHKKAFRRIKRNTAAANSDAMTADSEIIRGIRSIQNKDDFFAGVVRNRKVFSDSKAEVTFKDGQAMINDNVKFDPFELSQQPKDVKLNTASAAEPLVKVRRSALPQSYKMSISDYNEQIIAVTSKLQPFIQIAHTALNSKGAEYVGRIILNMQGFTRKDCELLIMKLAEFVLRIIKDNRRFVTRSFGEIMYYIWRSFVRPKVDSILQDLDIDVSDMVKFTGSAELVYDITLNVINEMYDAVENVLQDIIERLEQRIAAAQFAIESNICSVCSGHTLSDA